MREKHAWSTVPISFFYLLIIIIRNREVFVLKNKQIFISKERGYTYLKYLLFVAPCRVSKRTSLL